MRVWSSDFSAHDSAGVEIHVKGEACGVAAAKLEVAGALVAACCSDQPAVLQVKEPPPPQPMMAVPYPAPAYVDWSQAATPWAPWTMPAASAYPVPAMPSALVATPYLDFSGYGMASPDMMFTGFQPGGSAGAQHPRACAPRTLLTHSRHVARSRHAAGALHTANPAQPGRAGHRRQGCIHSRRGAWLLQKAKPDVHVVYLFRTTTNNRRLHRSATCRLIAAASSPIPATACRMSFCTSTATAAVRDGKEG